MASIADVLTLDSDDGSENEEVSFRAEFAEALEAGLSQPQKSIPCRFLYDARGSELFEEITQQPEYYPTRTETAILDACADALANAANKGTVLIEFGSGSSTKTEILLDAMSKKLAAYMPIDISQAALDEAVARLGKRYPDLKIVPTAADFHDPVLLPANVRSNPRVGFFPGSTIGNLVPDEAVRLLKNMHTTLEPEGQLIIGTDLVKPLDRIVPAYNDAAGATAAFNLNLLEHANREVGTDFDSDAFRHTAIWNEAKNRIEMHLISLRDQTINGLDTPVKFAEGECLHTENSHKYTLESFAELAERAGWHSHEVWTDRDDLFAVHLLRMA